MTQENQMIKSWPIGSTASPALHIGPVLVEHMCSVCTTETQQSIQSLGFYPYLIQSSTWVAHGPVSTCTTPTQPLEQSSDFGLLDLVSTWAL